MLGCLALISRRCSIPKTKGGNKREIDQAAVIETSIAVMRKKGIRVTISKAFGIVIFRQKLSHPKSPIRSKRSTKL
jgi:hypothetical protein